VQEARRFVTMDKLPSMGRKMNVVETLEMMIMWNKLNI
jgi:hypothetical protein